MQVECEVCGAMFDCNQVYCPKCDHECSKLFENSLDTDSDDYCENCEYFEPFQEIECKVLAKKFDRTRIEIDCPKTMKCQSHRRKK